MVQLLIMDMHTKLLHYHIALGLKGKWHNKTREDSKSNKLGKQNGAAELYEYTKTFFECK